MINVERTIGIKTPLKRAEKIRRYLSENNLLRTDLKINKDKTFIYFPIKKIPKEIGCDTFKVIKKEFEKYETKPRSYKEIISLSKKLQNELPTSYDIVGDIVLIKLAKKLQRYKKETGELLIKSNKNIKTVCLIEPVSGELRTRNIEVIAGEKRTETVHKEYGLKFNLDVEKTYFSPRLATERKRIANLVKPSETIIDMFTGVAPFSIMIAKYASPKIIYAIDKNQDAVKYARQNIKRNNVLDKIEVIHADVKKVHNILEDVKADRIIMNLPFSAHLFYPYALKITADVCTIHYYTILEEERIQERLENLKKIAEENRTVLTNLDIKKIKTYSPREFYIRIDIQAKKNMPM
jgi:tRNA (guanine37-N1)-methyltransferase